MPVSACYIRKRSVRYTTATFGFDPRSKLKKFDRPPRNWIYNSWGLLTVAPSAVRMNSIHSESASVEQKTSLQLYTASTKSAAKARRPPCLLACLLRHQSAVPLHAARSEIPTDVQSLSCNFLRQTRSRHLKWRFNSKCTNRRRCTATFPAHVSGQTIRCQVSTACSRQGRRAPGPTR